MRDLHTQNLPNLHSQVGDYFTPDIIEHLAKIIRVIGQRGIGKTVAVHPGCDVHFYHIRGIEMLSNG
jgi:hypothetical protein